MANHFRANQKFQQDVIIVPGDAFGAYFDASLVWVPVIGRMIYGGLRFKLKLAAYHKHFFITCSRSFFFVKKYVIFTQL